MPERDEQKLVESMIGYSVDQRGVASRLKLKIRENKDLFPDNFTLDALVYRLILGPALASPLAQLAVRRMLQAIGKETLADRVVASSTPFRSPVSW